MLKLKLCAALAATILFTAITSPAQTPPPATAPLSPEQAQLLKNTEAFIRTLFAWGPTSPSTLDPGSPLPQQTPTPGPVALAPLLPRPADRYQPRPDRHRQRLRQQGRQNLPP